MHSRYSTIVADPPWNVMAGPLTGREGFGDATGASRPLAYPSMTVDQIKAMRVADAAYLELFARDQRLGWHSWGNEVNGVALPLDTA